MRVVIADDTLLIRSGVSSLPLEGGAEVVGEAADADALPEQVSDKGPDVAVVDIGMSPSHTEEGIVAAHTIRQRFPHVAVVVLSQHLETSYAAARGVPQSVGYLLATAGGDDRPARATDVRAKAQRDCRGDTGRWSCTDAALAAVARSRVRS